MEINNSEFNVSFLVPLYRILYKSTKVLFMLVLVSLFIESIVVLQTNKQKKKSQNAIRKQIQMHSFHIGNADPIPKIPEMTLWPPGAWPPDSTTPIFNFFSGSDVWLGTSIADGCPNRHGNSFAISSVKNKKQSKMDLEESKKTHKRIDRSIYRERERAKKKKETWISSGRACRAVDDLEGGFEDGRERERVVETARLHFAVDACKTA